MKFQISILFLLLTFLSCGSALTTTTSNNNLHNYLKNVNSDCYWQQHADYKMEVDMDVKSYQYTGKQELVYTNNSPDTLRRVFYHLFFNAFQPGSEMDVRSRTISDPDNRVGDRISKLKPNEIGYLNVAELQQDGQLTLHKTVGTILEVDLAKPIAPGESTTFNMTFNGQVPLQIRRSGRDSEEDVALSMTQWYPKLAEYDFEGWHADPYIAREFHGVWGNFDVKITIDKDYVIGGTGYLQNPNDIGHGYQTGPLNKKSGKTLTWHFIAPDVHDFTWAADPDFNHDQLQMPNGPTLHFFYKKNMDAQYLEHWKNLQPKTADLMRYFSAHIGEYPYKQYSVIQGGDGGMEYAMCTLITGQRSFGSLVGVTAHELAHSWFQFLLATNESKHEWMDEGFTSYISSLAMNEVMNQNRENPNAGSYLGYIRLATSGVEQPLTTHADRYRYNRAYGTSAYSKGAVFMAQLGYIMGEDALKKTIKKYFNDFAFKHPTPNDFIRTAEKVSGMQLGWYLIDFGQTTNTIDYSVSSIEDKKITLERVGLMPMPLDVTVTYNDDSTEAFHIPLRMARGHKPTSATVIENWAWAYPNYTFETSKKVKNVEIDPKNLMADINKDNNKKSI
jgi:hypothetical protein